MNDLTMSTLAFLSVSIRADLRFPSFACPLCASVAPWFPFFVRRPVFTLHPLNTYELPYFQQRHAFMADTLSINIRTSLDWLFRETLDLTTVIDSSKLEYSAAVADGVAADQCDKIWHDTRTLAAGASDDLDLNSLTNTLFGSTVTINFAKVKFLLLVNTSTVAGDDLTLGGAASQEWTAWVGAAGDKVRVPADSCLLVSNKKNGWTVVNGSSDVLRIGNVGSAAVTYKIVLAGTSSVNKKCEMRNAK